MNCVLYCVNIQIEVCDDGCHNVNGVCTGGPNDGLSHGKYIYTLIY